MAAVLLRRVFLQLDYGDLHKEVDTGVLRQCQTELLQGLSSEPLPPIRRKIGDAVAEMARSSIGIQSSIGILYSEASVKYANETNHCPLKVLPPDNTHVLKRCPMRGVSGIRGSVLEDKNVERKLLHSDRDCVSLQTMTM